MQILFISEEAEILKFLSGLQAEAIMAQGNVEISGMAEHTLVTVICSGVSTQFHAIITSINNGYQTHGTDAKWLAMKFNVRRVNSRMDYDIERTTLND